MDPVQSSVSTSGSQSVTLPPHETISPEVCLQPSSQSVSQLTNTEPGAVVMATDEVLTASPGITFTHTRTHTHRS